MITMETYKPTDIDFVCQNAFNFNQIVKSKNIDYYNVPCAFDIETTSFRDDEDNKCATMYIWMLSLNDYIIIGRTWTEFINVLNTIVKKLSLWENRRLIIYVHNLAYEYQFIRHYLDWLNVFALDKYKPVYAVTTTGIEFRCSYLLSGMSLAKVGDNLTKYKASKKTGDLDYNLIRHTTTTLTKKELGYCINDVVVLSNYIRECIENEPTKRITDIPLTKTGYVRRRVKNYCYYHNDKHDKNNAQYKKYRDFISKLTIEYDEYELLQRAFQGGFTHANAFNVGKIFKNVASYDFTSSCPAVLLSEQFPMSKGVKCMPKNETEFKQYNKTYCTLFTITLYNVQQKVFVDTPISQSKCIRLDNPVIDNGRVVSADRLTMTITNVDFDIYNKFYKYSKMILHDMYIYKKAYLPVEIIESILNLYELKTTLKNVVGKEVEYQSGKSDLNSIYGMMVTNPLRDSIEYNDEWIKTDSDPTEQLKKYNDSNNRFIFYPWGVWCTAYARRNLFSAIYACGTDYIYADTDSVKIINADKHTKYFDDYNRLIVKKISQCLEYYNIDTSRAEPKTIKGVKKPLGVWDYEGTYQLFKTLGAKRYMTMQDYKLGITVAGLPKIVADEYLTNVVGKYNAFKMFDDDIFDIPKEYCHKNCSTYINTPINGTITDYQGNVNRYSELSFINLEPVAFNLSLSNEYLEYLIGIKECKI